MIDQRLLHAALTQLNANTQPLQGPESTKTALPETPNPQPNPPHDQPTNSAANTLTETTPINNPIYSPSTPTQSPPDSPTRPKQVDSKRQSAEAFKNDDDYNDTDKPKSKKKNKQDEAS